MAVSYLSQANKISINATDQTTVVCNKPTGTASGDLMVAIFTAPYTGSLTYTPPSGWLLASSSNGGGSVSLYSGLYYKIAGGSEPSTYTWTCSAAGSLMVGTATFRADNNGWNLYFSHGSGTTGVVTQPTSTPGGGAPYLACHALSWHDTGGSSSSCTTSAGTEIWDGRTTDGSPSTHERGSACYVNGSISAGGSTDSGATMTVNTGQTSYVSWTFAVSEEPNGPMAPHIPHFTSSLTGTAVSNPEGVISAHVPHFTSSLAGHIKPEGPIASRMPSFRGALSGVVTGPRVELLIDGVWTDVTNDVRYDTAVSLTTGRTAEGTSLTTTMANFTLDNRTDTVGNRYSIRNPTGIYYGLIGRNTKVRIKDLEYGYRFHGEVAAWTPGADASNNDQYVNLECSGLVRRLDASKSSVKCAMQREVMSASPAPVAYWPCNEGAGSTSFESPIPGVPRLSVSGGTPDYGSYTALKCSDGMPQVNTSEWRSQVLQGTSMTNGVTAAFLLASPGGITASTHILDLGFYVDGSSDGSFSGGGFLIYSGTNQLTFTMGMVFGGPSIVGTVPIVGKNGVMVYVSINHSNSTHNGNIGLWYQGEGDAAPVLVGTDTWAMDGVIREQITLDFNTNNVALSDASAAYIGQIAVWDGYSPASTMEYASVGAYVNEPAGTRFARLCTEEGITHTVNNPTNSSLMGEQLPNNVMSLLRECEATDLGIMYELRDDFGLGYMVRRDLYNQDVALALDYAAGDLAAQLQPTYDDKDTKNDVTVTRIGGSSARYVIDANSPLSTQDPPDGVGLYDTSSSVSLGSDFQCYPQAGWRAHLGTVDEERITTLGVALENSRFAASPSLRTAAMSVVPGSRVTVSNAPNWTTDVDQIVQGYSERFDQLTHQITYNTSSATPYSTAVAPASPTTTTAKADSLTSTLASGVDTDDTSLSVAVTGVLWSTTCGDFDISMAGEQMTVTAVSGTSSPQTFTVTRSVNGIVKSHVSGEQVRLYKPAIVGL